TGSLRLGLLEMDFAFRFGISTTTVSRLCIIWVSYLYQHLGHFPLWFTRQEVDKVMPPAFREKYPTTRVILDGTEIKCQVPSSLPLQSASFSSYKSTTTLMGQIGISPDGTAQVKETESIASLRNSCGEAHSAENLEEMGDNAALANEFELPFSDLTPTEREMLVRTQNSGLALYEGAPDLPPAPRCCSKSSGRKCNEQILTPLPTALRKTTARNQMLRIAASPVYACSVLFHAEIDCSVEASILQGIWTLHLNDSMSSRFRWIPHEPVRRHPKPRAVRANKNAAGEGLDDVPKGPQRALVALHGDRLILDAMPTGI
ncbi:hypothetical protein HPB47_024180, partial [Ixodes persulcatus]